MATLNPLLPSRTRTQNLALFLAEPRNEGIYAPYLHALFSNPRFHNPAFWSNHHITLLGDSIDHCEGEGETRENLTLLFQKALAIRGEDLPPDERLRTHIHCTNLLHALEVKLGSLVSNPVTFMDEEGDSATLDIPVAFFSKSELLKSLCETAGEASLSLPLPAGMKAREVSDLITAYALFVTTGKREPLRGLSKTPATALEPWARAMRLCGYLLVEGGEGAILTALYETVSETTLLYGLSEDFENLFPEPCLPCKSFLIAPVIEKIVSDAHIVDEEAAEACAQKIRGLNIPNLCGNLLDLSIFVAEARFTPYILTALNGCNIRALNLRYGQVSEMRIAKIHSLCRYIVTASVDKTAQHRLISGDMSIDNLPKNLLLSMRKEARTSLLSALIAPFVSPRPLNTERPLESSSEGVRLLRELPNLNVLALFPLDLDLYAYLDVSDETLHRLSELLPQVRRLLYEPEVEDEDEEGRAPITRIPEVWCSSLQDLTLTNSALETLDTPMPALKRALLMGNLPLRSIAGLNNTPLEILDISHTAVTSAPSGCALLKQFSAEFCSRLVHLRSLKDCPQLSAIRLEESALTDILELSFPPPPHENGQMIDLTSTRVPQEDLASYWELYGEDAIGRLEHYLSKEYLSGNIEPLLESRPKLREMYNWSLLLHRNQTLAAARYLREYGWPSSPTRASLAAVPKALATVTTAEWRRIHFNSMPLAAQRIVTIAVSGSCEVELSDADLMSAAPLRMQELSDLLSRTKFTRSSAMTEGIRTDYRYL